MKKYILSAATLLFATQMSNATVTLTLSNPATGVLNTLGAFGASAGTNGLLWGIVVDSTGNGFSTSSYQGGFTPSSNLVSGILIPGSGDDYLYIASSSNTTVTAVGGQGGPGSAVALSGMSIAADAGGNAAVSTGDTFAVIWFDTGITTSSSIPNDGTVHYGLYQNAGLTLPANGANQSYATLFSAAGPEPLRTATLVFGAPESSTTLLGAVGALALLRRRR